MPFVLAPLLWEKVSRAFRRPSEMRERAHGDGMEVGYDSPEAFEEVIWRLVWPRKYGESIALWTEHDEAPGFAEAFRDHMRRIIARRSTPSSEARYASKNNANIARVPLLRKLFPDCRILVPVRDPIGQAVSLLQQHRRFGLLHSRDRFSKEYMRDIGHLEFGELHRPIDFAGTDEMLARYRPDTLDYWVAYWECAFRHLLTQSGSLVFLSYEGLCAAGTSVMDSVGDYLELPSGALRMAFGDGLRSPREPGPGARVADRDLAHRARALHQELLGAGVLTSVPLS
jgi:hypothetical protein